MGLFGALGKGGTKAAAKALDANRTAKISAMEQSGIIRFKDNAVLSAYQSLPITHFGNPADPAQKEVLYEIAAKILKKAEFQQIASQGVTYCIVADSITGKATNGMIFHEKGVFDGGFTQTFIPREKMTEIGADKKGWIYIKDSDGTEHYLVGADSKKVRAEYGGFLKLLKELYGV